MKRTPLTRSTPGIGKWERPSPRERFLKRVAGNGADECWLWNGTDWYGSIRVDGHNIGAHRYSWILHHGPIPDGLFVCHRCDNPPCVNPAHLFLGTVADNTHDMMAKGRSVSFVGEQLPQAKLTPDDVRSIRSQPSLSHAALAVRFGVCESAIRNVRAGRNWKHVT